MGTSLVYAVIMKVKSNTKHHNEQNLFCIGRGSQPFHSKNATQIALLVYYVALYDGLIESDIYRKKKNKT